MSDGASILCALRGEQSTRWSSCNMSCYEMAPPAVLKNTYFENNTKSKTKIPKILLAFFLFLLFVVGLNFGFMKSLNNKIRPVAKCYYVVLMCAWATLSVAVFQHLQFPIIVWNTFHLIQLGLHILTVRSTKYTVYDFMNGIHSIDKDVLTVPKNILGILGIITYSLVMYAIKLVLCIGYCWYNDAGCKKFGIPEFIFCMPSLGLDVMSVAQMFIYYYVYNTVILINKILKKSTINLKTIQNHYVSVANCFDKIKPFNGKIVVAELLVSAPKLMFTCWMLLRYFKGNAGWFIITSGLVNASHMLVQIFVPSIINEMVNSQVDAVKLKLHGQLLVEQDEKQKRDIADLLRYMEARRLQQTVCRFIPVDIRLPLSLLSIGVTYFIVLIQFTHLVD